MAAIIANIFKQKTAVSVSTAQNLTKIKWEHNCGTPCKWEHNCGTPCKLTGTDRVWPDTVQSAWEGQHTLGTFQHTWHTCQPLPCASWPLRHASQHTDIHQATNFLDSKRIFFAWKSSTLAQIPHPPEVSIRVLMLELINCCCFLDTLLSRDRVKGAE